MMLEKTQSYILGLNIIKLEQFSINLLLDSEVSKISKHVTHPLVSSLPVAMENDTFPDS